MKQDTGLRVAIVGSTGAVGEELLQVLSRRKFPIKEVILLASKRSVGKTQLFANKSYLVEELTETSFQQHKIDLALFSAGSSISRKFAPLASQSGAVVIDNSSAFRMDAQTPLVIPEVNPEDLDWQQGIIANPNCSTIIMLMALAPIHKINRLKKIVAATYQATSGAGLAAMQELRTQTLEYLQNKPIKPKIFTHPIAFNAFSHDSAIDKDSGYNEEELKMVHETHKILKDDDIAITATCIRISSLRAHAEALHVELKDKLDLDSIKKALLTFPGLSLLDDKEHNTFPMPLEASGKDDVFVGRLRPSLASPDGHGLDLWCCGDQILKGAALNAVQIAETLLKR